ncbi:MAG TPA: hypothetical protein VGN26_12395 [Armatimonadota bacterium]|jgi:hypothetical protein
MPNYYALKFGSYSYADGNADGARWREGHSVRPGVVMVPRSNIARAIPGKLAPRQVTIEGTIAGDAWGNQGQLRLAVDAFEAAHAEGYGQLSRDDDRYLMAEVRSCGTGDWDGLLRLDYTVQFEAVDPYYYDVAETTDTVANPVSGAPHVIINTGTAPASPLYRFTASAGGTGHATAPSLTLLRTAPTVQTFTLTIPTALAAGDVIEVDTLEQTCTLNGANRMSWHSGDRLGLEPGSNSLSLTLANGLALSAWSTIYRARYL